MTVAQFDYIMCVVLYFVALGLFAVALWGVFVAPGDLERRIGRLLIYAGLALIVEAANIRVGNRGMKVGSEQLLTDIRVLIAGVIVLIVGLAVLVTYCLSLRRIEAAKKTADKPATAQ